MIAIKDLVNLRIQKNKKPFWHLRWLFVIVVCVGAFSCGIVFWSYGLPDVENNLNASIFIFLVGLFLMAIATICLLFCAEDGFFNLIRSNDWLYNNLADSSVLGYVVPHTAKEALLYLAVTKLLEYDPGIEFKEKLWDENVLTITGISKKYQTKVHLVASLHKAEDSADYKDITVTLKQFTK